VRIESRVIREEVQVEGKIREKDFRKEKTGRAALRE